MDKKTKIWIIIGVVVAVLLFVGIIYLLVTHPPVAAIVRDLFIIFVTLELFIIGALLTVLVWQIYTLTRMMQQEIKPMLTATQETIGTVRGTATFMSDQVVQPAIKMSSKVAGWQKSVKVLLGKTE